MPIYEKQIHFDVSKTLTGYVYVDADNEADAENIIDECIVEPEKHAIFTEQNLWGAHMRGSPGVTIANEIPENVEIITKGN